jgi:uncharacterized membrane protein YqaE (UPF0057 family)
MDSNIKKILAVVCALFLPPLGVLVGGGTGTDLIINIILTICFWFPGLLHALWVILKDK